MIASSQGGVNIEEVAAEDPDAIVYEPIDISVGLKREQACAIAKKVGLEECADKTADMLMNLYDLFIKKDALLVEINPYAEDAGETCKFSFFLFLNRQFYVFSTNLIFFPSHSFYTHKRFPM